MASCTLHILMISCVFSTMSYFFLKLPDIGSCASSLVYFLPGLSREDRSDSVIMGSLGAYSPCFFFFLIPGMSSSLVFRTLDQVSCDMCLHPSSILKSPRIPCCSIYLPFPSLLASLCSYIDFSILSESHVALVSYHGCGLMTGETWRSSASTPALRTLFCKQTAPEGPSSSYPQFILNS